MPNLHIKNVRNPFVLVHAENFDALFVIDKTVVANIERFALVSQTKLVAPIGDDSFGVHFVMEDDHVLWKMNCWIGIKP